MTWTKEERRRIIETLKDEAIKYRVNRKMLKYLETKAKIRAWNTPNLCKDYSERCMFQLGIIDCIIRHYPDKKDRKHCPNRDLVVWSKE